jgi:predicted glutamine amidotransferase
MGKPLLLADLITKPVHSLIKQSCHSKERSEPLNGDGFGIGWYDHSVDPYPCVFTSITPAWSNRNLQNLSNKIKSNNIFAHVRAATSSLSVTDQNCHPFYNGRYTWMHNGQIGNYYQLKRSLESKLSDRSYRAVNGSTDSELAFGIFLEQTGDLIDRVVQTTKEIVECQNQIPNQETSLLNFAVTDGEDTVVSRYSSNPKVESACSLYYLMGNRIELVDGRLVYFSDPENVEFVIVASEPLSWPKSEWTPVKENHLIKIDKDLNIEFKEINV